MILVIGYGNPLRSDDGVGWLVAEALREAAPTGVEVMACHQLTPELAAPIAEASLVIFIDALAGAEAGEVACRPVEGCDAIAGSMAHHVTPSSLMTLAGRVFGAQPDAYVITVAGANFGYEEGCTLIVKEALDEVLQMVGELIDRHRPPMAS